MFVVAFAAPPPAAAAQPAGTDHGKSAWHKVEGKPPKTHGGHAAAVNPTRMSTWTLDKATMKALLAGAPKERSKAARQAPLLVSLPGPNGTFQLFTLEDSPVMEAGLAAKHPDIRTYRGRGVNNATATIRVGPHPAGVPRLGALPQGAWYIDPYYQEDQSLYASYFGRDLMENPHGAALRPRRRGPPTWHSDTATTTPPTP